MELLRYVTIQSASSRPLSRKLKQPRQIFFTLAEY